MATPNSSEQFNTELSALQTDLRTLQEKVHMSDARAALAELDANIMNAPQAIENLRMRKYAFEAGLEDNAAHLSQQWAAVKPGVDLFIQQQTTQLETAILPIEARMNYVVGQAGNPDYALGIAHELRAELDNRGEKVKTSRTVEVRAGQDSEVYLEMPERAARR